MKFDKIVGFGDSWMWGDELLDPQLIDHPHAHPILVENTQYRESNCFLGQLGAHYGVPTENFGIPGGSLQSTIWTYLWWLEHEQLPTQNCLVLIALTDPNRQTFYNPNHVAYSNDPPWNRFVHSAWIHSGGGSENDYWKNMVKAHWTLTDCKQSQELNYKQTVLFFEGQSKYNTGTLFQFNTMFGVVDMDCSTLLQPRSSLDQLVRAQPNNETLFAPNRHPNQKGHSVIRDHLILKIDHVTMSK